MSTQDQTQFISAIDEELIDMSDINEDTKKLVSQLTKLNGKDNEFDEMMETVGDNENCSLYDVPVTQSGKYQALIDRLNNKMADMEAKYSTLLPATVADVVNELLDAPLNVRKVRNMNIRLNNLEKNVCDIKKRLTALELGTVAKDGKNQGPDHDGKIQDLAVARPLPKPRRTRGAKKRKAEDEAFDVNPEAAEAEQARKAELREVEALLADVVKKVDEFKITRADAEAMEDDADEFASATGKGKTADNGDGR